MNAYVKNIFRVQEFFNYAPDFVCSFLFQEPPIAMLCNCMVAIMCFKERF